MIHLKENAAPTGIGSGVVVTDVIAGSNYHPWI